MPPQKPTQRKATPTTDGQVPVVVMGLGVIGQAIAQAALRNDEVALVGAVDVNPAWTGMPLAHLLRTPAPRNLLVVPELDALGTLPEGTVLLLATGSRFVKVLPQLHDAVERGLHVVSTCEELAFPWLKSPDEAQKLSRKAERHGVSVLGTGVNPGFMMDRLPAVLGQSLGRVRRAQVTRRVDVRSRRQALQRKVGAGLSEDEFFGLVDREQVGHVGLIESCALCALGLGMDCDDFEEEIVPVIAQEAIQGGAFAVRPGQVAGLSQTVTGMSEGRELVRLELVLAMGLDEPGDRILLDADAPLEVTLQGGAEGDAATAYLVVNAAPRLSAAEPGLMTVLDLPAGR